MGVANQCMHCSSENLCWGMNSGGRLPWLLGFGHAYFIATRFLMQLDIEWKYAGRETSLAVTNHWNVSTSTNTKCISLHGHFTQGNAGGLSYSIFVISWLFGLVDSVQITHSENSYRKLFKLFSSLAHNALMYEIYISCIMWPPSFTLIVSHVGYEIHVWS